MIITDNRTVLETVQFLMAQEGAHLIGWKEMGRCFPDISALKLIHVAGNDVKTVAAAFNADYDSLEVKPGVAVGFLLSRAVTVSGLAFFDGILHVPPTFRKELAYVRSGEGAVDFYFFY